MNDKPIYALSGYAEWFWLMAKGWKDIENRDWSLFRYIKVDQLPIRIYLHASKTKASEDELNFISTILSQEDVNKLTEFLSVDWFKYRGTIIGEITIIGQIRKTPNMFSGTLSYKYAKSKWFFGEYGFAVTDGVLYDHPIPCRGKLGFYKPEVEVK
jgi:hypothetical protein